MRMDTLLPDWPESGVESSLRDTEEETAPAAPAPAAQVLAIAGGQRSKGSGVVTPVVLTPSGGSSPVGSQMRGGGSNSNSKGAWMDLDKFYADTEESEGEGDGEEEEEEEEESEESGEEDEDEDEDGEDHVSGEVPEDSEDDHDGEEENHTESQAFATGTHQGPS